MQQGRAACRVIRGTNFLTAQTHDAGVAVHDLFPAEVFHLRRTELLNALIIKIYIT